MMMRSMPPASSALAESPVPAPPPTIGTPRAIMEWNLSSMSLRGMAGIFGPSACNLPERRDSGAGEFGVVDMQRQPHDLAVCAGLQRFFYRLEQRAVGIRV